MKNRSTWTILLQESDKSQIFYWSSQTCTRIRQLIDCWLLLTMLKNLKTALFQTFSTWHRILSAFTALYWPSTAFYWHSTTKYQSDCLMTGAVLMILFIKNHITWFPSVQHCNWFGFRISLSLSRDGAIFRDEIENYFFLLSYDHSRISRRERDSILLLSCFETRSRLQKIISRGRARKKKLNFWFLNFE